MSARITRVGNGDAAHLSVDHLALASVKSGSNLETERRTATAMARAQWIARAAPPKVAKKPSPAVC